MATISITYEFHSEEEAITFVERGTSQQIMVTLRRGTIVYVITTTADIRQVNDLARAQHGIASF